MTWSIQNAKARFSELVQKTQDDGAQLITKNGHPIAIIMSVKEYDHMKKPKQSLIDFFKEAPFPEIDLPIERSKDEPRNFEL